MKRVIIMVMIILFMLLSVRGQENIARFEAEVKGVLKTVSPSIVKVVSQNHKKYVATGIALERDFVITNLKIISYPYKSIYVRTVKGNKYAAKVAGKDRESSLMLLKIDRQALTPIKKARRFEKGDWVALVGAFYQDFPSIYQGIVSSMSADELILNAPVAPGAPGGAVVNKKGELIGVIRGRFGFVVGPNWTFRDHSSELLVTSPRSHSKELCYAVPIKRVARITDDLKKYGEIKRGWLGVGLLDEGKRVTVGEVVKDSPADKAAIRTGDVILTIDGQAVEQGTDVSRIVKSLKPHQQARIKILRDGSEKVVIATIGELKKKQQSYFFSWPQAKDTAKTIPEGWQSLPRAESYIFNLSGSRSLGVDVMSLTPELAEEFKVNEKYGLLVSKIHSGSAAHKVGLRVADIIVQANDKKTAAVSDLRSVLNRLKDKEAVQLTLYHKGSLKKITVVPDKNLRPGLVIDDFAKKMSEFKFFDENDAKRLQEMAEAYAEKGGENLEAMKYYQMQIEKMKRDQQKLHQEIKKLRELLNKEKKQEREQPFNF